MVQKSDILLMEEIRRSPVDMVVYSIIYMVLNIPGGERRISEPSTVYHSRHFFEKKTHPEPWIFKATLLVKFF